MAHDPEIYPDPNTFNPSRFLDVDGAPVQLDPRKFVFGFGRRVCPGMSENSTPPRFLTGIRGVLARWTGAQLAEASIFVNMTGILVAFEIVNAVDDLGKKITPDPVYTDAALRQVIEAMIT